MCCSEPYPMMQPYAHALVAEEEGLGLPFNPEHRQIKSAG